MGIRMAERTDDRLIVALDFATRRCAADMASELEGVAGFFKLGLSSLAWGGLEFAAELKKDGKRIFLDLKLFDIGSVVARTVESLNSLGADFLTVHGDPGVVRSAVSGRGDANTKILAVTFLTSVDRHDLDAALIKRGAFGELACERATRAIDAGADGIIASAREAAAIRAIPGAKDKLIVTPGIRLGIGDRHDQVRVTTPSAAFEAGADHIVVGRPIIRSENPVDAAKSILGQLPGTSNRPTG